MEKRPPARQRRMPAWLAQTAGYAVAAVSLVWALRNTNFRDVPAEIRSLDWKWVALGVAADLAVYVTHAWRWKTLLSPISRLGFWRTVQAIYIGLFANEVLPLRVGELIRCYLLAHWNDLRISLVFASAAVERLLDGFFMLAMFFLTAAFVKDVPRNLAIPADILGLVIFAGIGILLWVVLHKEHAHLVLSESRWAATLRHIVEGLHLMGSPANIGLTFVVSTLYVFLQVVSYWALMRGYLFDLSLWQAAGVLAMVRLATAVPNLPGNLGLFNVACITALPLFGVEQPAARIFCNFVLFFALLLPLLIGGAVATALTGVNIRELRDRAHRGAKGVQERV